jgi:8-oxo-dGTP pyrophosphatase MutT (NUDIX family)
MRQPLQVLIYPVKMAGSGWEYLLLRRTASRGGFWQGVTGGVEEGEGLVEAARRELLEETNLVPLALEQIDYSYSFPLEDVWRDLYAAGVEEIVEYVFIALVDGQQEPTITWEHDKSQWCRYDQALGLLTWPGNIEALKRCECFVKAWSPTSDVQNRNDGKLLGYD